MPKPVQRKPSLDKLLGVRPGKLPASKAIIGEAPCNTKELVDELESIRHQVYLAMTQLSNLTFRLGSYGVEGPAPYLDRDIPF
jgi:hypothetical protein